MSLAFQSYPLRQIFKRSDQKQGSANFLLFLPEQSLKYKKRHKSVVVMTASNVLLFPGTAFDTTKFYGHWPLSMEVTQGAGWNPPPLALTDSEKPGLFRVDKSCWKQLPIS